MESKLPLPTGDFIAYHKLDGKKNYPGIIFLPGFMSDMKGIKACALAEYCAQKSYNFVRFDYLGHGGSSRKFTDCTIGIWQQNVLSVLDNLTSGPQILIGSSMGGWLMLLAALQRPDRIHALIGIASAPDFTEDLIWNKMSKDEQRELQEKQIFNLKSEFSTNPYPVTLQLITEARSHLLLKGNNKLSEIVAKVHLIHGEQDTDVPCSISKLLVSKLTNARSVLTLVKDGDHRMSTPENIDLMLSTLESVL